MHAPTVALGTPTRPAGVALPHDGVTPPVIMRENPGVRERVPDLVAGLQATLGNDPALPPIPSEAHGHARGMRVVDIRP